MKYTRELPIEGTRRTRKVFALLPTFFQHGSNNKPLETIVWLDYYYIKEHYNYGRWSYCGKSMEK